LFLVTELFLMSR